MKIQIFTEKYQQQVYQFIYDIMIEDVKKDPNKLKEELIPEQNILESYFSSGGCFWIVTDAQDEIIGTIGLEVIQDRAYLRRFYIKSSYRSCGIGTKLYHILEQFAYNQQVKIIYLSAGRNLTNAHRFYQKQGYQVMDDCNIHSSLKYYKKLIY